MTLTFAPALIIEQFLIYFFSLMTSEIFELFTATEYHLGLLKAKLAKYRQQLLEPTGKAGAKVSVIHVITNEIFRFENISFCVVISYFGKFGVSLFF
jgi:hypothetical protein